MAGKVMSRDEKNTKIMFAEAVRLSAQAFCQERRREAGRGGRKPGFQFEFRLRRSRATAAQ